jgi:hypothetical protein
MRSGGRTAPCSPKLKPTMAYDFDEDDDLDEDEFFK